MLLRDIPLHIVIAELSNPLDIPTAELIRMGGFAAVAAYAMVVAILYRMDRNRERKEALAKDDKHHAFADKVADAKIQEVTAQAQLNATLEKMNELLEKLVSRVFYLEDEISRLRHGWEARKSAEGD
jgi:hypothetical protein